MPNEFEVLIKRVVDAKLSDETWELLYEELKNTPSENIANVYEKFLQKNKEESNAQTYWKLWKLHGFKTTR